MKILGGEIFSRKISFLTLAVGDKDVLMSVKAITYIVLQRYFNVFQITS